jgi:hypothetical protein
MTTSHGSCASCGQPDWLDEEGLCIYCQKCPECGGYSCPIDGCDGAKRLAAKWRATRDRVRREKQEASDARG